MPEVDGIYYHDWADPEVIKILGSAIRLYEAGSEHAPRFRLHYGDRATGIDWMQRKDCTGYIGKGHGSKPGPVLYYRRLQFPDTAKRVQTDCIVRIRMAGDARLSSATWHHPDYDIDLNLAQTIIDEMGEEAFVREWGSHTVRLLRLRATLLDLKAQTEQP